MNMPACHPRFKHKHLYLPMWNAELYRGIVVATGADRMECERMRLVANRWNTAQYSMTPATHFKMMTYRGTVLFVRVE